MNARFLIVFRKELKETLRDRRTLLILLLFALLVPVMVGSTFKHLIARASRPEREGIDVTVIGAGQAPALMAQLRQNNITLHETAPLTDEEIGALLRAHKAAAVLRLSAQFADTYQAMRPARLELWFDSAADSDAKLGEVDDVLRAYSANVASARLLAHGVSPAAVTPLKVQRYDTGGSAARSASMFGTMLSALFLPAFLFCLSAAIDSTAGERERRSLEVLLAQPVRPVDLMLGKLLAAASLSVIGMTLELTLAHLVLRWLPLEEIGFSWRMSSLDLFGLCLTAVPLSLFAAALHISLAMNARSFKEAQTSLTFATFVPMAPGMVVAMLDIKSSTWMYFVPMLSNQTLLREMSKGQALGALPYLLTVVSTLSLAALAIGFASWRLKSERYVLSV